jgi:two-component system, LytTR family, response regulator
MALKPIRTIIIDDDKDWHDILETLVKAQPQLSLIGSFTSPIAAHALITEGVVDLILQDIEMPDVNGFEFIKSMTKPPLVIFITSHLEYGVKSYEVNAVDYLVKPISIPRFLQAIEKVVAKWNEKQAQSLPDDSYFFIRENNSFVKIEMEKILYLKSLENYTQIITLDHVYTTLIPLSDIKGQLPDPLFKRVHRSYVVNISKITSVNKTEIRINHHEIPLTRSYVDALFDTLVNTHLITKNTIG